MPMAQAAHNTALSATAGLCRITVAMARLSVNQTVSANDSRPAVAA